MAHTISTATICFNNLEELKTTIDSVDKQNTPPYEHIIVDGSTNDEIKNYLEETEHPAYRKWISEPDEGIADAFNKGVKMATGDIVHLLNSGDMYYDETVLERELEVFDSDPEVQWTHGKYLQKVGGAWVITGKPFSKSLLHRGFVKVGHPTMFVKKALYEKHGYFNTEFRYSMDYDFLIRIQDEKFKFIEYPVTIFTPGGVSNVQWKAAFREVMKSYIRHKGWDLKILWGYVYQLLFQNVAQTSIGRRLVKWKNRGNTVEE